jgi:hypothetical protein
VRFSTGTNRACLHEPINLRRSQARWPAYKGLIAFEFIEMWKKLRKMGWTDRCRVGGAPAKVARHTDPMS